MGGIAVVTLVPDLDHGEAGQIHWGCDKAKSQRSLHHQGEPARRGEDEIGVREDPGGGQERAHADRDVALAFQRGEHPVGDAV